MGYAVCKTELPFVPNLPEINTRSAMFFAPNNGIMLMPPNFFDISDMTMAMVDASVIMQNVPIGRTREMHLETHVCRSALWWALCFAGVPKKYGGFVITKSNVRFVRHVVMSASINSTVLLFNAKFSAHARNISDDVSMPVICACGLFAVKHSDTPPEPIPTSRTVFAQVGANAASHTASDVGLYIPRCIFMRPPIRVKISCFVPISIYNKALK